MIIVWSYKVAYLPQLKPHGVLRTKNENMCNIWYYLTKKLFLKNLIISHPLRASFLPHREQDPVTLHNHKPCTTSLCYLSSLRVPHSPHCSLSPRHTGLLVIQIQRLPPTSGLLLGCSSSRLLSLIPPPWPHSLGLFLNYIQCHLFPDHFI